MTKTTNVVRLQEENIPPHLRPPAQIVPGEYELECASYTINRRFDRDVLTVWWSVLDYQGEVILPRYYSIGTRVVSNRTLVSGKRHGVLVAEFGMLFGHQFRIDRIPVSYFKHQRALGEVKMVTRNYEQKLHADNAQYSVVDTLVSKT